MFALIIITSLYALDEQDIDADIAQAQSVEALVARMEQAPKAFRHRYIEAITAKTSLHNREKRELLTQEMIDQLNAEKGHAQVHALTGGGNGASAGGGGSGSGSGSGSGGGKGNGGRGGGRK